MCQLFSCPRGVPSRDVLWEANRANPHGIGFAWVEDGRVNWSKGYGEDRFAEAVELFEAKSFPKAIHFRLATHGGREMDMTHPFNITKLSKPTLQGRSQSVLFHNGVWTDYDDLLIQGLMSGGLPKRILDWEMSDSRAMAVLAGNFGERVLDLLNLTGEKVLVLRGDGESLRYGHWYLGDQEEVEDDEEEDYSLEDFWDRREAREKARTLWFYSNQRKKDTVITAKKNDTVITETTKNGVLTICEKNPSNTTNRTAKDVLPRGSYLNSDYEETMLALREWEGSDAS